MHVARQVCIHHARTRGCTFTYAPCSWFDASSRTFSIRVYTSLILFLCCLHFWSRLNGEERSLILLSRTIEKYSIDCAPRQFPTLKIYTILECVSMLYLYKWCGCGIVCFKLSDLVGILFKFGDDSTKVFTRPKYLVHIRWSLSAFKFGRTDF